MITVTESLILKKQEKALDVKDPKPDKSHASKSHKHRKHQSSDSKNASKSAIPREWGIKAEHYEVGQRCQVQNRTTLLAPADFDLR